MNATKVFLTIACYQNALKMNEEKQNESQQVFLHTQDFYSSITDSYGISHSYSDLNQPVMQAGLVHNGKDERLNHVLNELHLGQRIHDELKRQGRTVTWLAQRLCMERTSLYYVFRQSSINTELLLQISYYLNHDFFLDVSDLYKDAGL